MIKQLILTSFVLALLAGCGGGSSNTNTSTSTNDNTEPASKNGDWYHPAVNTTWQIQLTNPLNSSYDVALYDVDLFDTDSDTISMLKSSGKKVICYFSAGSFENWRPDSASFSDADYGAPLDGWAGEWWLDIRSENVKNIMKARLDLAVSKGCDGVDPDNMDGYTNNPGINFSANDQLEYNKFIAEQAHQRKLAVGLKNGINQLQELASHFDFAINEQCFQYDECDGYAVFTNANKPVFNIEYNVNSSQRTAICNAARQLKLRTLFMPLDLDGSSRYSCDTAQVE